MPSAPLPSRGLAFILVATAFAAYAFVPSGLAAHLLAMFGRAGIDPATVVLIGALFGPSQVGARLCEFVFASNVHPLNIARLALGDAACGFALLALFGFSVPVAMVFVVMFGAANGLITITRGAVPLALFGAAGYGAAARAHRQAVPDDAGNGAARARLRGRTCLRSAGLALVAGFTVVALVLHGRDPAADAVGS